MVDTTPWCVQVDLEADDADVAAGALWAAGVTSVQEIELDGGRLRLLAGTTESEAQAVVAGLAGRWSAECYPADYDGWLDAWRPFARSVRVGRLIVHPAWEEPASDPDDLTIAIDAQRAFGQGNHPTSRLMLASMDDRSASGHRLHDTSVLDVGCGSGVLSVAAAKFGAARVVAVDIEPAAVDATIANAERNQVESSVEASTTPVQQVAGAFDVVLANILAPVLVELAPAITARVAPGGRLLLCGLLLDQRSQVLAAYPHFSVTSESTIEGWLALTLTRT